MRLIYILRNILFPPTDIERICETIPQQVIETSISVLRAQPSNTIAFMKYRDPLVKALLHGAKYYDNMRAIHLLGEIVAPLIVEEVAEKQLYGSFHAPLIIPIPLHPAREKERGFNQTERIVHAIITHMNNVSVTLNTTALARIKNTHTQTRQHGRSARFKNVQHAFRVVREKEVQGSDILLVDDIVTTGATLMSARDALLAAGAREVHCIAIAH